MSKPLNKPTTISRKIRIKDHEKGLPIALFLTSRFTYFCEQQWINAIELEHVLLNQKKTLPSTILNTFDEILFTPEPYIEPEVATDYSILAEDEDFLFIHKPPNLPCHPAGRYLHNTLLSLLQTSYSELYVVNRLDRETSGIVIFAKNIEAARHGGLCLMNKSLEKKYNLLVEGSFPTQIDAIGYLIQEAHSQVRKKKKFFFENDWDSFIKAQNDDEQKQKLIQGAQRVHTSFTKICEYETDEGVISKLEANLHTGKNHQIRATACSIGFPVVGDKMYGLDSTIFIRFIAGQMTTKDRILLRIPHQALHCTEIRLSRVSDESAYIIRSLPPNSWYPWN